MFRKPYAPLLKLLSSGASARTVRRVPRRGTRQLAGGPARARRQVFAGCLAEALRGRPRTANVWVAARPREAWARCRALRVGVQTAFVLVDARRAADARAAGHCHQQRRKKHHAARAAEGRRQQRQRQGWRCAVPYRYKASVARPGHGWRHRRPQHKAARCCRARKHRGQCRTARRGQVGWPFARDTR